MSTCARCGLPKVPVGYKGCSAGECAASDLDCRNVELANLRSLLRSVTGKLESALEQLDDLDEELSGRPAYRVAVGLIAQVLEVLA